jgi:DNA-binding response OmpR family regulator
LRARIKAALRRGAGEPRQVYVFGDMELDFGRFEVRRAGRALDLTPIEFKLLVTLVQNRRMVLTRQQLLDQVWGRDIYVTDRVVDTHIGNLRKKIETDAEQPAFLVSVRGVGYRFEG